MTTLREALADWSDWDDAVVAYGVVVGLFVGPGRDANRVVLTDNPVSAALRTGLLALVDAGVLEQREDEDEQFRWVDADRAAESPPSDDQAHGPLGGPADTTPAPVALDPESADGYALRDLAAVIAGKGISVGSAIPTAGADAVAAEPVDVPTVPATRPANPVHRKWWQRG